MREVSLTHPELASFLSGEFLLHVPCCFVVVVVLFCLSGEFLSHIPCWLYVSVARFSYTSHACFVILWGVSLTHSMLVSFFFSFLIWGVSLTHPLLALVLSGEFLLHIPCLLFFSVGSFFSPSLLGQTAFYLGSFSHTSHAGFFLCGEFLAHKPCWLLYVGSLSYTSGAGFFMWKFFLTCPMLACSCWEFILHILCWLLDVGSFFYTS